MRRSLLLAGMLAGTMAFAALPALANEYGDGPRGSGRHEQSFDRGGSRGECGGGRDEKWQRNRHRKFGRMHARYEQRWRGQDGHRGGVRGGEDKRGWDDRYGN